MLGPDAGALLRAGCFSKKNLVHSRTLASAAAARACLSGALLVPARRLLERLGVIGWGLYVCGVAHPAVQLSAPALVITSSACSLPTLVHITELRACDWEQQRCAWGMAARDRMRRRRVSALQELPNVGCVNRTALGLGKWAALSR